ncbi:MAG: class I tRNA ligase family protein, partial [Candidatus Bathyarchaeia archaeon]
LETDDEEVLKALKEKVETIAKELENCRLQSAANDVISISRMGNQYLNEKEPWKLIKKDREKALSVIYVAAQIVKVLAITSAPFMPFAAEELWKTLNLPGSVHKQRWDEALKPLPPKHKIGEAKPLFRKIEVSEKELDELLAKVREKSQKT